MTMRTALVVVLLAIAATALATLLTGTASLGKLVPGGLPVGNALAALGLCAMGGAAVVLSPRRTWLRSVSLASLAAAAAWLPVSVALAGNLALNFSNGRGEVWLALSASVALGVLFCTSWGLLASLLAKSRGRAQPDDA